MSRDKEDLDPHMAKVIATNRKTRVENFVRFFPDDTIGTVRERIGEVADVHPDRLFITVTIERPTTYFSNDPRNWEALFNRLSYGTGSVLKFPFQLYQSEYRSPATAISHTDFGSEEWMTDSVKSELSQLYAPTDKFTDQLIFGVKEESLSYVLPPDYDVSITKAIPSAAFPLPQLTSIMSTLYPEKFGKIVGFTYTQYEPVAETSKNIYFPYLQETTPERIPEPSIQLLKDTTKKLKDLLDLSPTEKEDTWTNPDMSVLRARFIVPFVDTDLGGAVRTRFEQIFYGLTVSEKTPSITLFTGRAETSRHKFYVKDVRRKTPQDLDRWMYWWSATKPTQNRPTLVLYQGKSEKHFNRIAITSARITFTAIRPEGKASDLDTLKTELGDWFKTLDAVTPFIDEKDLQSDRWELEDTALSLKYTTKLLSPDWTRTNCIGFLFDTSEVETTDKLRILRTDHSVAGLSSLEVRVIQMIKDKPAVSLADIQNELGVSPEVARTLKSDIERKASEDESIYTRSFRGFPTITFPQKQPDTVLLSFVSNIPIAVKYANLIRYIARNVAPERLNPICPPRKSTVAPVAAIAPAANEDVDTALANEYADMFGEVEGYEEEAPNPEEEPVKEPVQQEAPIPQKKARQGTVTLYNYFNSRLQKLDPETFDPTNSQYPKKCEKTHQPVILDQNDLDRLSGTPYDIRKADETWKKIKKSDIEVSADGLRMKAINPSGGLIVCPDFWCMTDEIPLRESDLEDGKCPKCKGKVRTSKTGDPVEFSVIARDKAFMYPGLTKYKSPRNQRQMPCCYKEPESMELTKNYAQRREAIGDNPNDIHYIMDSTATGLDPYRCAFLSESLLTTLAIDENYVGFKGDIKRLKDEDEGIFRVGIGRPSKTLPRFLENSSNLQSLSSVLEIATTKVDPKTRVVTNTWKLKGPENDDKDMRVIRSPVECIKADNAARKDGKPENNGGADILGCSFLATWRKFDDEHVDEIMKHPKFAGNTMLARIVSGIDKAFKSTNPTERLTVIQELEYAAVYMQCDIFRLHTDTNTIGCMFQAPLLRPRKRSIIILQSPNQAQVTQEEKDAGIIAKEDYIDVLACVYRTEVYRMEDYPSVELPMLHFRTNVYVEMINSITEKARKESRPYLRINNKTRSKLEQLRNRACSTKIPTYTDALKAIAEITPAGGKTHQIITDPYGRAQAFYIPQVAIVPFRPTPLPQVSQQIVRGYDDDDVVLLTYESVRAYLEIATKYSPGYAFKEDVTNAAGQRVEVMLESNLRIPVVPAPGNKNSIQKEIIQTIRSVREAETTLAFGEENKELKEEYNQISYTSEVFDFLMFELSNDLVEKYPDLRAALMVAHPSRNDVDPLLREWFNAATFGVDLKSADQFVTKVRKPCGTRTKDQCSGNVCGWDGDRCKIQVKNTLREGVLFNRLLSTLVGNAKLRGMVLDGRSSPFFGTILYVELPHERIMTDQDFT
jgi:hypothetical protein